MQNLIEWKRLRAEHKNKVKTEKRQSYRKYLSTINIKTSQREIYKAMRTIKGRPPRIINILKEGDHIYKSHDEIANRLSD